MPTPLGLSRLWHKKLRQKGQVFLFICHSGQRGHICSESRGTAGHMSSEQTDVRYCLGNVSVFNSILWVWFDVLLSKIWGVLLGLSFVSKAVLVSPSTVDYTECRCFLNRGNRVYQIREAFDIQWNDSTLTMLYPDTMDWVIPLGRDDTIKGAAATLTAVY